MSEITVRLDEVANDLEAVDSRLALALDQVSDLLEGRTAVKFERGPLDDRGHKKFPELYHDEKSQKDIHKHVEDHYEEYKNLLQSELGKNAKVTDIVVSAEKPQKEGDIQLRYEVDAHVLGVRGLSKLDNWAMITSPAANKFIIIASVPKIKDKN